MFYLYDLYPQKKGKNRFEITSSEQGHGFLICREKSKRFIKQSLELLINVWEGDKVPEKCFTPSKGPFLCVTGHSEDGVVTYLQPWYQVRKEVDARGEEFTA